MKKVVVSNPFVDICAIEACAVKGIDEKELFDEVNNLNPTETGREWKEDKENGRVDCQDYPDREHIIFRC